MAEKDHYQNEERKERKKILKNTPKKLKKGQKKY